MKSFVLITHGLFNEAARNSVHIASNGEKIANDKLERIGKEAAMA
jgi:hypothetical protein